MSKRYGLIVISLCFSILLGCGSDRKKELQAYVEDLKARSIGQVEPLPEVKPYETFSYSAQMLRSPFEPQQLRDAVVAIPSDNGIVPDAHRRKELLESFPLDALRMVGTMEQNKQIWAIVVDTEGTVHRITKGNYVGQNHGKIERITEEVIDITEIVPDGGGWREREASMTLVE